MKVIDTSAEMISCYEAGKFDIEKWKTYIDGSVPGAKDLCMKDMQDCINAGFRWEKDFLPVLEKVVCNEEERKETIRIFHEITDRWNESIVKKFGRRQI